MDDQITYNAPAPAATPPVSPQPTIMTPKKSPLKKVLAVIVVLILLAASLYGGYYYGHRNVSKLESENATLTSQVNKLSNTATPKQTSTSTNTRSFYDCQNAGGTLSKSLPLTCTVFGNTYDFPASFDIFQVDNLARVPSAAISLVTSVAKDNFTKCSGNLTQQLPSAYVALAQTNFVDMVLSCDSGHHEYLGLNSGKWQDLGGGTAGLDCSMVKTYGIKQSSIVSGLAATDYTNCNNSDGTTGTVPVN